MRKKIGECLIQAGLITEQDLQTALAEQRRTGERVGSILVRLNLATEKQTTKALAYQLGFAYVSLAENPPDVLAMTLIPKEVARMRMCVATRLDANLLTVAISDPTAFGAGQDLELQTGYRIKYVVATHPEILDWIDKGYRDKSVLKFTRRGPSDAASHGHGENLARGGCVSCARALQPGWSFCPFCAAPTAAFCSPSSM
jgi:type IV pilus assembly protein PilB